MVFTYVYMKGSEAQWSNPQLLQIMYIHIALVDNLNASTKNSGLDHPASHPLIYKRGVNDVCWVDEGDAKTGRK